METQEIAKNLVAWCRQGDYAKCYQELYSPNAVSQEPDGAPWETATGMDEIRAKGEKWSAMVEEVHSSEISEPVVADGYFTCSMTTDATFKGQGRVKFSEICLYEVNDGKIVKEQFFYPASEGQASN